MDKRKFKEGDFYRVCARCGEWVSAKAQRCDNCNDLMQMTEFFEVTKEDILPEKNVKTNGLKMRCHRCNTVYDWGEYTLCPHCNEVLVAEPIEKYSTEEMPVQSKEDIVKYCYTVYRYSHGKEIPSRKQRIPFEEKETAFGRKNFTADPRLFFDTRTAQIDRFYCNISTDNAIICQDNGKLFIQHLPGKSIIKVNGAMLCSGEKKELHDGDLLRFGNGQDKEHMIDVHIHKVNEQEERVNAEEQRWLEMMTELKKIKASTEATESRLNGIEKVIETIRPEDLLKRSNEKPEEFDERIDKMIPAMSSMSMEEEIIQFLQIEKSDGTVQDCSDQLEAVRGRKQIVSYLYQAAFLEKACESMPKNIQDYSAALNSIGRAFEEFICTEVLSLVYKANAEDFQNYIHRNNLKEDSLQQGRILNYLLWRGRKRAVNKPWEMEGDVHIYNLVQASGYDGSNKTYFWECRNAIQNVKYATGFRNGSSHAQASADTRKESVKKYIEQNSHTALSEKEYLEQKEKIFATKGLSILHRYYQRACKNEDC